MLAVSLGQSAVYSILSIIDRLTQPAPLSSQTSDLNSSVTPDRPWLDLTYQVVNIAFALVPVLLVLYLLSRNNPRHDPRSWRTIGFDLRRPVRDLSLGLIIAAAHRHPRARPLSRRPSPRVEHDGSGFRSR